MSWKRAIGSVLIGIGILAFFGLPSSPISEPSTLIERLTGFIFSCGLGIFLIIKDKKHIDKKKR